MPKRYAFADNFGFARALRRRFNVSSAWGKSLSYFLIGKLGSTLAKIDLKCDLKLWMARSALFAQC